MLNSKQIEELRQRSIEVELASETVDGKHIRLLGVLSVDGRTIYKVMNGKECYSGTVVFDTAVFWYNKLTRQYNED